MFITLGPGLFKDFYKQGQLDIGSFCLRFSFLYLPFLKRILPPLTRKCSFCDIRGESKNLDVYSYIR